MILNLVKLDNYLDSPAVWVFPDYVRKYGYPCEIYKV